MSTPPDFARRLDDLLASAAGVLSDEHLALVKELIDHGEGGEAIIMLASLIAEGDKRAPAAVIAEIRDLAEDYVDENDLRPDLDSRILEQP
jgi:hypothetical protein